MNTHILDQYHIEFSVISDADGDKSLHVRQIIPTDLNFFLSEYFEAVFPVFFQESILPEIDKAILGQPFDENGGGVFSFLKIGRVTSSFSNTNKGAGIATISTIDLKEIINSWVEWVTKNKLEKHIL